MPVEELLSFLQQATAKGSKSTALNPLAWALGILLSALLVAFRLNAPMWALIALGIGSGATMAIFLAAYIYFVLTNPDALRSERFTLSKMAMQQSEKGDDLHGFFAPDDRKATKLLSENDSKLEG